MSMEKNCTNCGVRFSKASSDSRKYWRTKRFCSLRCFGVYANTAQQLKGTKRPPDVIEKCLKTAFKKGQIPWNKGKPHEKVRGENHHNWKGGVTELNRQIRSSLEMKLWRKAVFERDDYTCVDCGVRGGQLHADHIKPFALYPELRFATDNGRALCAPCHRKTPTYGSGTLYAYRKLSKYAY